MADLQVIQDKIYEIRGQRVMLDRDLAEMYGVTTSALNQSVKRNAQRFPEEFMFRISKTEWENMSSQFVTTSRTKTTKKRLFLTLLPNKGWACFHQYSEPLSQYRFASLL